MEQDVLCHLLFLKFGGKLEYVCDYYFCLTPVSGHSSTTKKIICYPNLSLALR